MQRGNGRRNTSEQQRNVTPATPDRVAPAEAARRLGVNRSTLSRYFRRYPELVGSDGLVSIAEVRQHRADNVNGVKSANYRGGGEIAGEAPEPAVEDTEALAEAPDAEAGAPAASGRAGVTYADAKRRREEAAAHKAELDLAERLGQLTPKDEIEGRAADLAQQVRERAGQVVREVAERAAVEHGLEVRVVRTALEQAQSEIFASIADDLAALVQREGGDRDTA